MNNCSELRGATRLIKYLNCAICPPCLKRCKAHKTRIQICVELVSVYDSVCDLTRIVYYTTLLTLYTLIIIFHTWMRCLNVFIYYCVRDTPISICERFISTKYVVICRQRMKERFVLLSLISRTEREICLSHSLESLKTSRYTRTTYTYIYHLSRDVFTDN